MASQIKLQQVLEAQRKLQSRGESESHANSSIASVQVDEEQKIVEQEVEKDRNANGSPSQKTEEKVKNEAADSLMAEAKDTLPKGQDHAADAD